MFHTEVLGIKTCTAASHKGAVKMFWPHFSGAVMSYIYIHMCLWPKQNARKGPRLSVPL